MSWWVEIGGVGFDGLMFQRRGAEVATAFASYGASRATARQEGKTKIATAFAGRGASRRTLRKEKKKGMDSIIIRALNWTQMTRIKADKS